MADKETEEVKKARDLIVQGYSRVGVIEELEEKYDLKYRNETMNVYVEALEKEYDELKEVLSEIGARVNELEAVV